MKTQKKMRKCSYINCNNIKKKGSSVSFFQFPKDINLCKKWVEACLKPELETVGFENLHTRGVVICSEHFKDFDFRNPLTKKRLKPDVVPNNLFISKIPKLNTISSFGHYVLDPQNQTSESYSESMTGSYLRCHTVGEKAHCSKTNKSSLSTDSSQIRQEDEMFKNDLRNRPPFPLCKIEISPLSSNDTLQSRHKDLVSPQRLMNITENSCPLMRPISPLPMGGGDSEEGNYLSILPEVTLTTPFSPGGESNTEDESEDEFPSPTNSPLPSHLTPLLPPPIQPPESHITPYGGSMTSSVGTRSLNAGTTKALSQDWAALKSATKRPFECSTLSTEDINLNEPRARKYKKILPKRECDKNREDDIKFAYQKAVENIPPNNGGAGSSEVSLNLRGLQIRKLETVPAGAPATQSTTALFIDNNLIKTLPTIDAYKKLTKISASDNQIDSLIWFGRLPSLQYLNLARNKVKDIQGLWKLCLGHLTHVDLSGNEIKVLRGHSGVYKIQLEILDLSANQIGAIENLSMLTNLKELFLHQNQIQSLAECKTNLPVSLTKLTLAENSILSLGDVAELSRLENLHSLSLRQNLCTNVLQIVDSGHNPVCPPKFFDYRPYVLTWCPNLVSLDERPLSDQEKLKAEWLLSEGKTRETSAEKHAALVTYLSNVCPSLGPQNTFTQSQPEGHIQGQSYGHATSGQVKAESVSHPKLTGSSGDIGTLSSSLMQVPLPVNNNTVKFVSSLKPSNNKSGLKSTHPSEITRNNVCSTGCPCKHYIELIEEKAKNHKLLRKTESLEMDNEMLMQRVQLLEDSLSQNGFDLDQLNVKIEEEEE